MIKLLTFFLVSCALQCCVQGASIGEFTNDAFDYDIEESDTNAVLTSEEKLLVKEFASEYGNLLTDDYLRSDALITGLLRGSHWDLISASKMLNRILAWRFENHIDELGKSKMDSNLCQLFPFRINATTKEGCPVLEMDFGQWNVAHYILSHPSINDATKSFSQYTTQMWEKARSTTKNISPKCDQTIILVDLNGFSENNIDQPNVTDSVIQIAKTVENYYPNLIKTIICINSPPDLVLLMATLMPYVSETPIPFTFYIPAQEDKARRHIYSYVDPQQLSPRYLGQRGIQN